MQIATSAVMMIRKFQVWTIDKLLQRLCHNHRVQMNLNTLTSWYGNAFRIVREIQEIHQWLVDSPQKGSVMRCFIFVSS